MFSAFFILGLPRKDAKKNSFLMLILFYIYYRYCAVANRNRRAGFSCQRWHFGDPDENQSAVMGFSFSG
jgi:hypothetical protein